MVRVRATQTAEILAWSDAIFLQSNFEVLIQFTDIDLTLRHLPPEWTMTASNLLRTQGIALVILCRGLRAQRRSNQFRRVPSGGERTLTMNIYRSTMAEMSRKKKEETNISNEHSNMAAENIRTIRERIWDEWSICKSTH